MDEINVAILNAEYNVKKEEIDRLEESVKKCNETLKNNTISWNFSDYLYKKNMIELKCAKDDNERKVLNDQIAEYQSQKTELEAKIDILKKTLEANSKILNNLQGEINEILEALMKNQDLKDYIKQSLKKKYEERKNENLRKKEEFQSKEAIIAGIEETIKQVDNKEKIQNALQNVLEANKLQKEINSLNAKNPKDSNDTTLLQKKSDRLKVLNINLDKDKTEVADVMSGNELKELLKYEVVADEKGKIQLTETLTKIRKQLDEEIKKYNNSIAIDENAINAIGNQSKTADSSQAEVSDSSQAEVSDSSQAEGNLKWYQFIKRFKNWNEKRKQKALPLGKEQNPEENRSDEGKETLPAQGSEKKFRASIKFDKEKDAESKIIKDLLEKIDSQTIEEAKKKVASTKDENFETPISQDQNR